MATGNTIEVVGADIQEAIDTHRSTADFEIVVTDNPIGTVLQELDQTSVGISTDLQDQIKERLNEIQTSNSSRDWTKYVRALITFGNFYLTLLQGLGPIPLICRLVLAVASFAFEQNVGTVVERLFQKTVDQQCLAQCWAASNLFKSCFRYMSGLPSAESLDTGQKEHCCNRLASDCPVTAGADVLGYLECQIRTLSERSDLNSVDALMNKVQVYCSLASFRELFLLSRMTVERAYGVQTGVQSVIRGQRDDDEKLLQFLCKPARAQLDLFFACRENDWPILNEFLQRRQLLQDLRFLNGKYVRIWSEHNPNSCLSFHEWSFLNVNILSCLRCHRRQRGQEGERTRFLFRSALNDENSFTIHPGDRTDNFVFSRSWVQYSSEPEEESRTWRILKLQPEATQRHDSYLIVLASQRNKCIFTDNTGLVNVQRRSSNDTMCFWRLEVIS